MTKIFPAPPHRHDPHQAALESAVDKIQDHLDNHDLTMVGMRGFPAAHVNLGWLREHIQAWVAKERPSSDTVKEQLSQELLTVVQRVKKLVIDYVPNQAVPAEWRVEFWTKDDRGYYEYDFHFRMPR
jgi:hypothetical protein